VSATWCLAMSSSLFAVKGEDMEVVEGLLKNLDLSGKEKRGIRVERSATVGGVQKGRGLWAR
jgi:hypothetical protein